MINFTARTGEMLPAPQCMALLAGAILAAGCTRSPDLSTPDKAADALAVALNSGNYERVVAVLGQANIQKAISECEERKKGPEPTKTSLVFELEIARRQQDCAKIPDDLRAFARFASENHVEVPGTRPSHPVGLGNKTSERKLEDGRNFVAFDVLPPHWSGKKDDLDQLVVVQQADGNWVPMFGANASTPLANVAFSLPECASLFAPQSVKNTSK